jgi:hypothetical protein
MHLVEFPFWAAAGQNLTVHLYARLKTAGKFGTQLPRFRLLYPGETDETAAEFLESWTITDNNDWQYVELNTGVRTQEGPIWLRLECQSPTEDGNDVLYWFYVLDQDSGVKEFLTANKDEMIAANTDIQAQYGCDAGTAVGGAGGGVINHPGMDGGLTG